MSSEIVVTLLCTFIASIAIPYLSWLFNRHVKIKSEYERILEEFKIHLMLHRIHVIEPCTETRKVFLDVLFGEEDLSDIFLGASKARDFLQRHIDDILKNKSEYESISFPFAPECLHQTMMTKHEKYLNDKAILLKKYTEVIEGISNLK